MAKEKVGLALGGGGLRGSYQIGAYLAMKDCRIKIDMVSGTSIGSFNAAMIASHKEKKLLEFWMTMKSTDYFEIDPEIVNEKMSLTKIKYIYKLLIEKTKNKGFNIEPLRKKLDTLIDEDGLRKSNIRFGLCTVRGKKPEPIEIFIEDMKKGKIVDYILASCFLPIFKKEKLIDGSNYLDGGFWDTVPVGMLVREGCTKVYAIELKGFGYKRSIHTKSAEVIRIKSRHSLGSQLALNNDITKELVSIGYYDTMQVLKKLDGIDYYFVHKRDAFYERVLRKFTRLEVKTMMARYLAKDEKELVIKLIERVLKKEKKEKYQIYYQRAIIKHIQKDLYKDEPEYKIIKRFSLF